jgi:DNA (cytosine-5)-methyltransferase 1
MGHEPRSLLRSSFCVTAYYNEIDGYCAEWLRRLIAAGEIAPGEVDERSITEVSPDDLKGFTQCHFFAGLGGWSYAMRLAGWSDQDPGWTGSCPCQPLSITGQQQGHTDERHLWPAFHRLIAQRRPPIVFGEQVASGLGREWTAAVRHDLEEDGYAFGC